MARKYVIYVALNRYNFGVDLTFCRADADGEYYYHHYHRRPEELHVLAHMLNDEVYAGRADTHVSPYGWLVYRYPVGAR